VSACAVPVMVTVGAMVVVPFEVVVGIVAGAVYSPVASIEPQLLAATPVAHVTLQLIAVLLLPVTLPLNCWVRLVITLAVVGATVIVTVDDALDPHPTAPSAAASAAIAKNFHHLIPVLPKILDIGSRIAIFGLRRPSGLRSYLHTR